MARIRVPLNNFVFGEINPSLTSRIDSAVYNQAGQSVKNVFIRAEGGIINRPGSKRDDGQEPDGFKLELWNELAISFVDAHRKGDLCDVWGRVKSESWEDRTTGETRTGLVVMVDSWQPIGGQAMAPVQPVQAAARPAAAAPAWQVQADPSVDQEIPF